VAFAEKHAKREAELADASERLQVERDRAVRVAYREGLPMAAIARVIKISHQRVSQIVRS
jgi:DNA-directed RNA polymerase specialized sigma subunit